MCCMGFLQVVMQKVAFNYLGDLPEWKLLLGKNGLVCGRLCIIIFLLVTRAFCRHDGISTVGPDEPLLYIAAEEILVHYMGKALSPT